MRLRPVKISGSLPDSWEAVRLKGGRIVFVNRRTKMTTWLDPRDSPNIPRAADELPYGWEELQDCEGRFFYINHITGTQTLIDPRHFESERQRLQHAVASQKQKLQADEAELQRLKRESSAMMIAQDVAQLERAIGERKQVLKALEALISKDDDEDIGLVRQVAQRSRDDLSQLQEECVQLKAQKDKVKADICKKLTKGSTDATAIITSLPPDTYESVIGSEGRSPTPRVETEGTGGASEYAAILQQQSAYRRILERQRDDLGELQRLNATLQRSA